MTPDGKPRKAFDAYRHIVKRGKAGQCIWCLKPIQVGEVHWQWVGVHEGDFQDWRVHEECKAHCDDSIEALDGPVCPHRHGRGNSCEESHG